jgi:hypothetical protein
MFDALAGLQTYIVEDGKFFPKQSLYARGSYANTAYTHENYITSVVEAFKSLLDAVQERYRPDWCCQKPADIGKVRGFGRSSNVMLQVRSLSALHDRLRLIFLWQLGRTSKSGLAPRTTEIIARQYLPCARTEKRIYLAKQVPQFGGVRRPMVDHVTKKA